MKYRYEVIWCDENGEKVVDSFLSDYDDLELDPYGDRVPVALQSAEYIRLVEQRG